MKKKAIERIPYIGLKKNIRPKTAKYIGITAIRIVGHEKHLFLEVYRNAQNQAEPVVRVVLNKKEFGTYIPATGEWNRRQIMSDEYYDPYFIWNTQDEYGCTQKELEKQNILQTPEDLERIKKFCKGVEVWDDHKWWKYIYRYEQNISITARRKAEDRRYERRQNALNDRISHTKELPEKEILETADSLYFHHAHYLYYKKRGCFAQIACSKCGGVTTARWKAGISFESQFQCGIEEPREGQTGTCPLCGAHGEYKCQGKTCALITADLSSPNSAIWSYELENKMPIEVVLKLALKETTDQEKNSVEIKMDSTVIKTIPKKELSKQWTEVTVDAVELEAGVHKLRIEPTKNGSYTGVYITDIGIYAYRSDQTEAKFSVLSDSISSEITRAKDAEKELSSSITQTAESISTKVEQNGIISAINQTAETISIKASKIDFNGMITANSYFQIKTDGSFVAKKGTIGDFTITGGKISTGSATMSARSHAIILNGGLEIHPGSGSAFSDGSDAFRVFNLKHVTSGGHLVFGDDGATVSYLSSSSKRYKDHVAYMTSEEAKKILSIPVVWFIYKAGYLSSQDRLNGKKLPGLYAEDVYTALPEAAQINENGEVEDWNFRVIIPAMLKLIQNLYERNQDEEIRRNQ